MKMFAKSLSSAAKSGGLVVLMTGSLLAMSPDANAENGTTPTPAAITPPYGNFAFMTAHAVGTQNYICLPDPANPGQTVWIFVAPQATLSTESIGGGYPQQTATHFLRTVPGSFPTTSPGCTASNISGEQYCPSWQTSFDSSKIWGEKVGSIVAGTDRSCPVAGAIPCLLLQAVATASEPQYSRGLFSRVTYVQRLNTAGGAAPTTACTAGQVALVPYTADYTFFARSTRP